MKLDYEQVPLVILFIFTFSSVAFLCHHLLTLSAGTVHDGERGPPRASQPPGDCTSLVCAATHHASCLQVGVRLIIWMETCPFIPDINPPKK